MSNYAADIRKFISDNFLFGQPVELDDATSFLDEGVIDSTGMLELVAHLEASYGIKVEDHELIPENLDSIRAVVVFVTKKMGQTSRV